MKTTQKHHEIPYRPKIRLRLDSDVVEYFKTLEEYEELINDILRHHVDKAKRKPFQSQ